MVYRVPNMHSDCHAKEPGLMAWQSEHILMCRDVIGHVARGEIRWGPPSVSVRGRHTGVSVVAV